MVLNKLFPDLVFQAIKTQLQHLRGIEGRKEMRNKQFCWSHAGEAHFLVRRCLAIRSVGTPLPVGGAIGFSSVLAGRIVVIVAVMTFFGSYLYGIGQYGWALGMAVGWLPSLTMAWLSAQTLAFIVRTVRDKKIATSQPLLQFGSMQPPSCCRGRTTAVLQYWRRDKQFP